MSRSLQIYKSASTRYPDADHIWTVVARTPFRKILKYCFLFVRHLRLLSPFLHAPQGTNLRRLVKARPEIYKIVLMSYLAANWDVRMRVDRMVDHCATIAQIGGIVDLPPDVIVDVICVAPIDSRYRITLDQPRWLLREGQLILSLWDGVDRIFNISFCLSTQNGKRVAYIGAMQGRAGGGGEADILARYRRFSKAAWGMRPRDFLVEVFKMFCRALDVSEIHAIADANCPQRELIKLSYDEIWRERGGHDAGNGFFLLPVKSGRRAESEIPPRKRAMYRKRYAMLDAVEAELCAVLTSSVGPRTAQMNTRAAAERG